MKLAAGLEVIAEILTRQGVRELGHSACKFATATWPYPSCSTRHLMTQGEWSTVLGREIGGEPLDRSEEQWHWFTRHWLIKNKLQFLLLRATCCEITQINPSLINLRFYKIIKKIRHFENKWWRIKLCHTTSPLAIERGSMRKSSALKTFSISFPPSRTSWSTWKSIVSARFLI